MNRIGIMVSVLFFCFVVTSCTSPITDTESVWLRSIDSLESYTPPPVIAELCQHAKRSEIISASNYRMRIFLYEHFGISHFKLGLFFDSTVSERTLGFYAPNINVIRIFNSEDTILYGGPNVWVSRALLLLHEVDHSAMYLLNPIVYSESGEENSTEIEELTLDFLDNVTLHGFQGQYYQEEVASYKKVEQ